MDNEGDFGAFLVGFLVGGLVGAAVALLLAPQSGFETRMLIKDKSIELKDKTVQAAEEARVKAEAAAADARARAEEIARYASEKGDAFLHRGQPAAPADTEAPTPAV